MKVRELLDLIGHEDPEREVVIQKYPFGIRGSSLRGVWRGKYIESPDGENCAIFGERDDVKGSKGALVLYPRS